MKYYIKNNKLKKYFAGPQGGLVRDIEKAYKYDDKNPNELRDIDSAIINDFLSIVEVGCSEKLEKTVNRRWSASQTYTTFPVMDCSSLVAGKSSKKLDDSKGVEFKKTLDSINSLLEYKNKKYGNAALEPLNIFQGKCKVGQRLDDKLARVKNSEGLKKNDIADLIGYLTLVCVENGWDNFDEFMD